MKTAVLVVFAGCASIALGCGVIATPIAPPIVGDATPTPQVTEPGAVVTPDKPVWWPADVHLPDGAVLTSGVGAPAIWKANDQNADGIKERMQRQATAAGYHVYAITQSPGSIYELLFTKSGTTYTLTITQGSDATILAGDRTGVIHLQMSGTVDESLDLPLRERLNLSAGSEISIGTAVPNDRCSDCQYYLNIHIAPFNGPGSYASKPKGIYLIDVELIPGGTEDRDDYRWAKQCTVQVEDPLSGNYACGGLENVNDSTKVIDITGNWRQPAAP